MTFTRKIDLQFWAIPQISNPSPTFQFDQIYWNFAREKKSWLCSSWGLELFASPRTEYVESQILCCLQVCLQHPQSRVLSLPNKWEIRHQVIAITQGRHPGGDLLIWYLQIPFMVCSENKTQTSYLLSYHGRQPQGPLLCVQLDAARIASVCICACSNLEAEAR